MHPRPFYQNLRPGIIALIIPVITISLLVWLYQHTPRIIQPVAPSAETAETLEQVMTKIEGITLKPERQFAYYMVQKYQTPESLADHFGIAKETLTARNPGPIVPGVTIKIPPIESPLKEQSAAPIPRAATISERNGGVEVHVPFKEPHVTTSLPKLAEALQSQNVITKISDRHWRIDRPLFLRDNIRLQVTKSDLDTLELKSSPSGIVCLCLDDAEILIDGVTIRSIDPETNQVDTSFSDERSFLRALGNSRMDILNSDISYLGNPFMPERNEMQRQGAAYGIAWRTTDNAFGRLITTGWVENNTFHHNHFGSYMYGASGMTWRNNVFRANDRYGLDPHDDSNNALIEGNRFESNGKHGFIVSKRCNYNIIRNNISVNNRLHGFMLHEDSNFNVIENNTADGNVDNIAIYHSNYNVVRNNTLRDAKSSNVRINEGSNMTLITDNTLEGGQKGIFAYGNVDYLIAKNNQITTKGAVLAGNSSIKHIVFVQNRINVARFDLEQAENIVIEANQVMKPSRRTFLTGI